MTRLMALLAFAIFAAFLGILVIHVPHPDLVAITCVVIALAGYDAWTSSGKG